MGHWLIQLVVKFYILSYKKGIVKMGSKLHFSFSLFGNPNSEKNLMPKNNLFPPNSLFKAPFFNQSKMKHQL